MYLLAIALTTLSLVMATIDALVVTRPDLSLAPNCSPVPVEHTAWLHYPRIGTCHCFIGCNVRSCHINVCCMLCLHGCTMHVPLLYWLLQCVCSWLHQCLLHALLQPVCTDALSQF
jgi:hypothetical protein